MFGVMGMGSAFINAAGRGGRAKKSSNEIRFIGSVADPNLAAISCIGQIKVISIKNGETISESYNNLNQAAVSIQSDANTEIIINGDVTLFASYRYGDGYVHITSLDVSKNTVLTNIVCDNNIELTSLDLSANTSLNRISVSSSTLLTSLITPNSSSVTSIDCASCSSLTSLDLSHNIGLSVLVCNNCTSLASLNISKNTALGQLSCSNCIGLKSIYYPANQTNVSASIANAITNADAADGTVYTDSDGAYYSTIADAATAKGWTIEQLS